MKSRCFNRELTIEMIVGTFMASVLVVLVLFTIIISGGRFMREHTRMEVLFREVMGLRRHDNVLVRGVPVGSVQDLRLENGRVRVILQLNQPVRLREDYRIRVISASILGGNNLIVEEGNGAPLPPHAEVWGDSPLDIMKDVAELVKAVRVEFIDGGIMENLRLTSENLAKVTTRIAAGEGTLGRLFSSDDVLYREISATVSSIRNVSGRLERGEGLVGRLLSDDDTLYRDLWETIAALKQVATRLEAGEGTVGRLLSADDTLYEDLSASIASLRALSGRLERGEGTLGRLLSEDDRLYEDLAATAGNLRTITGRVVEGEGTLGRLLSEDDEVYQQLEGLLGDARETLDDLRESSPVVTFTSVFFGAF